VPLKEEFVNNGRPPTRRNIDYETSVRLPAQKESLSDLASRTKAARDQLSKHRVLLDRYLPVHLGKPNDVVDEVEYKYGELVQRMPHLEYNHRSRDRYDESGPPRSSFVEPYKPAPRPPKLDLHPSVPVKNSFTPKVSDVRKRARSVLCKIKGDPRYFDFS